MCDTDASVLEKMKDSNCFIFISVTLRIWLEMHGITVNVLRNGLNDLSSNPGGGCLHFPFAKSIHPSLLPTVIDKL